MAGIIAHLWRCRIPTVWSCQNASEMRTNDRGPADHAAISFADDNVRRAFVELVVAGDEERRAVVAGWGHRGLGHEMWVFIPRGQLPVLERWLWEAVTARVVRAAWWNADAMGGPWWTFDVIDRARPCVGWRLNCVSADPTMLISPNIAGVVKFLGHLGIDSKMQFQTPGAQRASCPAGCGTTPGADGCGLSAVAAAEDLMEVHAWFERRVREVNRAANPFADPLVSPKWNPPRLDEFGAVSRVAGWGRHVHVQGDGLAERVQLTKCHRRSDLTVWRSEWMRIEDIWLCEPLADYADGLRANYPGVPVTVLPTRAGLSPLASIVAAVAR
jgi:hypothetical protein